MSIVAYGRNYVPVVLTALFLYWPYERPKNFYTKTFATGFMVYLQENLTDELVNLIQMNEARKQKKLEELTFKLSMDPEVVAQREAEAAAKLKVSLKIFLNIKDWKNIQWVF